MIFLKQTALRQSDKNKRDSVKRLIKINEPRKQETKTIKQRSGIRMEKMLEQTEGM